MGNRNQQYGGGFEDTSRAFGNSPRQQQSSRFDLSALGNALPDASSPTKPYTTQESQGAFSRNATAPQGGSGSLSQENAPSQLNHFPAPQNNAHSLPGVDLNQSAPHQYPPRQVGLTQERSGMFSSNNLFTGPGAQSQFSFGSNRPQLYNNPVRHGFQGTEHHT